jgi:hypothetical protein
MISSQYFDVLVSDLHMPGAATALPSLVPCAMRTLRQSRSY